MIYHFLTSFLGVSHDRFLQSRLPRLQELLSFDGLRGVHPVGTIRSHLRFNFKFAYKGMSWIALMG